MDEKTKTLCEITSPIFDWLKKYGNPHTTVVVNMDCVRVTEDVLGDVLGLPKEANRYAHNDASCQE